MLTESLPMSCRLKLDQSPLPADRAGSSQETCMNAIDRKFQKKIEKLENLDEIEARLARQEKMSRMVLIAVVVLTVVVFAMPLGHILAPSWMPLGHRVPLPLQP
jgi:hypothetical protein